MAEPERLLFDGDRVCFALLSERSIKTEREGGGGSGVVTSSSVFVLRSELSRPDSPEWDFLPPPPSFCKNPLKPFFFFFSVTMGCAWRGSSTKDPESDVERLPCCP